MDIFTGTPSEDTVCYFRIIFSHRFCGVITNKMSVISIDEDDEPEDVKSYARDSVKNEEGESYYFMHIEDAIKYINRWYMKDEINDEFYRPKLASDLTRNKDHDYK